MGKAHNLNSKKLRGRERQKSLEPTDSQLPLGQINVHITEAHLVFICLCFVCLFVSELPQVKVN